MSIDSCTQSPDQTLACDQLCQFQRPTIAVALATAVLAMFPSLTTAQPAPVAEAEFVVLPMAIELSGADARATLLIQRTVGEMTGAQVHQGVELEVVDPSIARLHDGQVVAVGNGQTELTIRIEGLSGQQTVPVRVEGAEQPRKWEFEAHVKSILARQGCNSGACHGALAGKGGFRLSLLGYDGPADHFTITRQDRGRRIEPADPGRSLLLAKPTTLIPHKGGLRLEPDSDDYHILAEWIRDGYEGPSKEAAQLERVEVLPAALKLSADDKQQLLVRAHYSDGRVEDVTHWAKFSSSNETVASVDEAGQVQVLGPGKGAIVVWFASRIETTSIIVPYKSEISQVAYRDFQPANFIDEILLDEWKALGLEPSPGCDDPTFLRRVSLDATGTLPSVDRVRQFVSDTDPDKRRKLIDEFLGSESYVDYWAYKWSDLFLVNGNLLRPAAVQAFYKWIRLQVEQNTPWDEFARQIVLAKGDSYEQGATNFYAIHQDPESLTENTAQAFMGLSIGCAKCHNHPLEKWTNDQYYAMANLYARVRAKGWGGDTRNGDGKRTLVVLDRGDLIQPNRGKPQPPAPLDAPPIDLDDTSDRRIVLAEWLTSPKNTYFSRSIVNRVWANYMGVGLVESVDDLRASNPASSERLLDTLAAYLVEKDYDLQALTRLILNSQVYQRSSRATAGNVADGRYYGRYFPRRLMAEVLHDGIVSVTGVPSEFTKIEFPGADTRDTDFYPEGTRSIELYDSAVANYFLKTFGRHQRRITCECERSDQATVVQALHLNNGGTINDKLSSPKSIVAKWVESNKPVEEVVESAYLSALSRWPTPGERETVVELVRQADKDGASRQENYEDLLWSLMTSPEFLFSH